MRRCFVVVAILFLLPLKAQTQIDSLKNLLNAVRSAGKDQNLAANYEAQVGWALLELGKYDSALYYFKRSLSTATGDSALVASNYNSLGIIYNNLGILDSAINYYEKAFILYSSQNDTTRTLTIANNLAIIYKNQGLYEKALETAFAALSKLEKMPADRTLASSFNTVASVYARMGDHSNALTYFKRSLAIRKAIGFDRGVGQSYNNIGETYISMAMYDSALSYLLLALEIKKRTNDRNAIGTTLNFIGRAYLKQRKYREAEPLLLESAAIKRSAGEQFDEGIALNNLAELKLATNDLASAEAYLNAAINLFRNTQALAQLKESLELRVRLYKLKRNPFQALAAMEELIVIKDSLLTKEKVESLLAMQIRYESEKKAQQIQLLEREDIIQKAKISAHKYWIGGLATTIILLAIIVILVYINFRLARSNKEHVETLLKELHHRVKNNLQLLSSIFSLQAQTLTDERAIQVVKTTEARINAMALIHRKLYNIDRNRTLNIKDYIVELLQYLTHAYGYQNKQLDISTNISDVQIDVDKAIPLGLILNELISNAFKYAFVGQPHPELKIDLQLTNEQLHIHLCDNGMGLPSSVNAEPGTFGLRMVNMLVRQLRGTIVTNIDLGTHYSLQIPAQ